MAGRSWDEIDQFRGTIVKGEWPTIPELYEMAVKRWPDHISFSVFEPEKKALTFAEAYEKIRKAAAYLRSKGVSKGDRVLLNGKNSPDWAIAYFAILYAGGVIVPIDNQMHVDRCMRLSEFADVKFAIADFDVLEKMKDIGGKWYSSLYGTAMLKGRDVNYVKLSDVDIAPMEQKVEADSIAYRLADRKYGEGLMSFTDMQQAYNKWYESQAELVRTSLMVEVKRRLLEYYRTNMLILQ